MYKISSVFLNLELKDKYIRCKFSKKYDVERILWKEEGILEVFFVRIIDRTSGFINGWFCANI